MSNGNGAPPARGESNKGERSHRAEARRFLTTPMARSLIRGLDDEERTRAWLGVANELKAEGEIGPVLVEEIVEQLQD